MEDYGITPNSVSLEDYIFQLIFVKSLEEKEAVSKRFVEISHEKIEQQTPGQQQPIMGVLFAWELQSERAIEPIVED